MKSSKGKKIAPKRRLTLQKKILRAARRGDLVGAHCIAQFGKDKLPELPRVDRLRMLIHDWFFLESCRTDPRLRESAGDTSWKHDECAKISGAMMGQHITARDSAFFRMLADMIDEEAEVYRKSRLRPGIDGPGFLHQKIITNALSGSPHSLSQIARDAGVSVRQVTRLSRALGIKPGKPGRPKKT